MEKILKLTLDKGRFDKVKPARSAMMKSIRSTGTKSTELLFHKALLYSRA